MKIKKTRNKVTPILLILLLIVQMFLPVQVFLDPPRVEIQKAEAYGNGWLDRWDYRTPITIDDNTEDLTDYQVKVTLQGTDSSVANYVDFDKVLTGGADIRFTDDNKITPIDFWIEEWVDTSESESATVWIEIPSLPTAGIKTVYVYYGANVSSGSDGDETFEFFDDFDDVHYSGSWTTKTVMTHEVADVPCVTYDSKLYCFGGYADSANDPTNHTQEYTPTTDTWTDKAVMPRAVWGGCAAIHDTKAYYFGGVESAANIVYNETMAYNLSNDTWETKTTDLPSAISNQGSMAVTVGDYIYLFFTTYVYKYDPANDSFTELSSTAPVNVTWGTAAYINVSGEDRIYIIGGYNWTTSQDSDTNYYYKISTNNWSIAQASAPYSAWGGIREGCIYDGEIYYGFGRRSSGEFFARLYSYNPGTNTWSSAYTEGNHTRDGVGAGMIDGKLYVVGGRDVGSNPYGINYTEEFDPTTNLINITTLDTAKWSIIKNDGTYSISNSIITLTGGVGGGWYHIVGKTGFSPETILRMKSNLGATVANPQITQAGWYITSLSIINVNDLLSYKGTHYASCGDGTDYTLNNIGVSHFGDWYTYEIARLGTSTKMYKDGILINDCAYDLDGDRFPYLAVRDSVYQTRCDWILVRKYTSDEPISTTTSSFRGYNKIFTGITNTISATDYVSYSTEPTVGNLVDMTITPASGSIDTSVTTWNTSSPYYKKWTETGSGDIDTAHTVGDLEASKYYTVWYTKDGESKTRFATAQADDSGEIPFTYDQGYSDVLFEIEEDTTAPVIFDISSPSDNSYTNDNTPTLSWNASSDSESGLAKYQLYIDGVLNKDSIDSSAISTEPTSSLSDGSYTWYIKAIDNAGNERQSTSTRTIGVDVTSPVISLVSPANNSSTSNTKPTLTWSGSDTTSGISKYQLYVDNSLDTDDLTDTSTIPTNNLSCGSHTWYVRAIDNASNSTDSLTFNLIVSCGGGAPNSTPPIISLLQNQTFEIMTTNNQPTINLSQVKNAYQIAVSTTPDFENVSWEPYQENIVLPDAGKIYIKFRSPSGGVSEIYEVETRQCLVSTPINILNGSLVRAINDYKVYIINNNYKRHILDGEIFNFYGHLNWENIQEITSSQINNYQESFLIRGLNDYKVYEIKDEKKCWLNIAAEEFINSGYSWDEVYIINERERDFYGMGEEMMIL